MNIYMLRHGETDWNMEGRLQGHTDIPLNRNGKNQIKKTAGILNEMGINIDLIFSSPLARAYTSAEIVADIIKFKKEDIIVEPLLIERSFGVGEGLLWTERAEKYPGDNYPRMESMEQLLQRANDMYQKLVNISKNKENILLVAHGAILYAILTVVTEGKMVYGGPLTKFEPGSIHLVRCNGGAIEVAKYSEQQNQFVDIF